MSLRPSPWRITGLVLAVLTTTAWGTPDQDLERAENALKQGDFAAAGKILDDTLAAYSIHTFPHYKDVLCRICAEMVLLEAKTHGEREAFSLAKRLGAVAEAVLERLREENVTEASYRDWAARNNFTLADAVEVLNGATTKWPLSPTTLPLAGAVLEDAEGDQQKLLALPAHARMWVAMYLARKGRGNQAIPLVESVTPEEARQLPRFTMWNVCSDLFLEGNCPGGSLIAFKKDPDLTQKSKTMCHAAHDLFQICDRLGDPEVMKQEFVPFAEQALGLPEGNHEYWFGTLYLLLRGLERCEDYASVVTRGRHWLDHAKAEDYDVAGLYDSSLRLFIPRAMIKLGQIDEAVDLLRQIAREYFERSPHAARAAADELHRLGKRVVEVQEGQPLPPMVKAVEPDRVSAEVAPGQEARVEINVTGTVGLRVRESGYRSSCVKKVGVGTAVVENGAATVKVEVTLQLPSGVPERHGTLFLYTNDLDMPVIELPTEVKTAREAR